VPLLGFLHVRREPDLVRSQVNVNQKELLSRQRYGRRRKTGLTARSSDSVEASEDDCDQRGSSGEKNQGVQWEFGVSKKSKTVSFILMVENPRTNKRRDDENEYARSGDLSLGQERELRGGQDFCRTGAEKFKKTSLFAGVSRATGKKKVVL